MDSSFTALLSSAHVTVTVCGSFQLSGVNVKAAGSAVTAVLEGSPMVTVTLARRLAIQLDRVSFVADFIHIEGRVRDGKAGRVVVDNVDVEVLIDYRIPTGPVHSVCYGGLIVHRIIIFMAGYRNGLRFIPIVWRESQGRRLCRHIRIGGVADGHGRVVAGLASQRNRVSGVATFVYSQSGIREDQDRINDVAVAVAVATATATATATVVIVVIVVIVAAVFAVVP